MKEQSITTLQTQLSFQEDTIAKLNDIVTQHQQDIMQLQKTIQLLQNQFSSLIKEKIDSNERPPHY